MKTLLRIFPHMWVLLTLLSQTGLLLAQVSDDFSDGNFTSNPAWAGDADRWQVSGGELQSQGITGNDEIHLATASSHIQDTEWRIYLRYSFAPSGSNQIRFYLTADSANLEGDRMGYYVQIGETGSNDALRVFRQDGGSRTEIAAGNTAAVAAGIDGSLRILRDGSGNWTLFSDLNNSGSFTQEASWTDATYTSSAYTGVWVKHSSSRNESFFFDDLYAGPEIVDSVAPQLIGVETLGPTQISLQFTELLDSLSTLNLNAYTLTPGGISPSEVLYQPSLSDRVELRFAQPLDNFQAYALEVSGLEDRAGNAIDPPQSWNFIFLYPETAVSGDIIMNEIYPDPTPSLGLPEGEFLELYNRSNKFLDLTGWTLSNGSTVGSLPSHGLLPDEFVILCRASDTAFFQFYGPVLGLSTWPALVNGGDNLGLRNAEASLIDSVEYLRAWFADGEKDDGGYSLERIYTESLDCPAADNWGASRSFNGGTPGIRNSIQSDTLESQPPLIEFAETIDDQTIRICFNESMDDGFLLDGDAFSLNPGNFVWSDISIENPSCVVLHLASPLPRGQILSLTIEQATDCKGNVQSVPLELEFALGETPAPFDLVFTELMPDPEPATQALPEAEYVELLNRSEKVLSLEGLVLADNLQEARLTKALLFPGEYLILCAASDSLELSNFGSVLPLSNMPSLNNSLDSLYLRGANGELLEFLFYTDDWYQDEAKSAGGWSLSRIDPDLTACSNPDNWAASQAVAGGTPGQANLILGSFPNAGPPEVLGVALLDGQEVELLFSESMDQGSLETLANYSVDGGLGQPILAITSGEVPQSVRLVFAAEIEANRVYTLEWSSLADCAGLSANGTISFGIPLAAEEGDVLINEILFNPYPGGSDFVEIINASDKVLDIADLVLGEWDATQDSIFNSDPLSLSSQLLLPNDILCLSKDVFFQQQQYAPPTEANFLEMNAFPTYDDNAGGVVVFTKDSTILDRFSYEDDDQFALLAEDEGVSLERLSISVPASSPGNWQSASASVGYATPGYTNSQRLSDPAMGTDLFSLQSETISPDGDGFEDQLALDYQMDQAGQLLDVRILDLKGRLIKQVQEAFLAGTAPGTFIWDGLDELRRQLPLGPYIVWVRVRDQAEGNARIFRYPIALVSRF